MAGLFLPSTGGLPVVTLDAGDSAMVTGEGEHWLAAPCVKHTHSAHADRQTDMESNYCIMSQMAAAEAAITSLDLTDRLSAEAAITSLDLTDRLSAEPETRVLGGLEWILRAVTGWVWPRRVVM